jgi:integrase
MKLDAKTVSTLALPSGKGDVIHFDEALPGFGYRLRLGAGGRVLRSWVAQYRRAGATRRLLLGAAEVLSAEQARAAAKKVLAKVALGEDPQADKAVRRDKDKLSLLSIVREYLSLRQSEVRPKTMSEITRYLTGPYFKPLHGMPIDTIAQRDVAACLVAIARQRGNVTSAQARRALSAFFVWAMGEGVVTANPVIGTRRPKEETRDRTLTDPELVAVWRACEENDFGRIVKLLFLTGARRGEVGGMCWSEIDLERGTWTIPKERSKNGRQHILPLTPLALKIIAKVLQRVGRDHLFGDWSGVGFTIWDTFKKRLDGKAGVSNWVVHDIRRSVATKMADIGIAPHVIEQILNHQSGHKSGVAGIYNRSSYTNEVRAALALWTDHVEALVKGRARKVFSFPTNTNMAIK